jgi:hypothetical protein
MSGDLRDRVTDRQDEFATAQQHSDTWVKSYRYLRMAMVGLLIALGVAVFYQTWRQGFHLLGSVSAYYYTPAQAIFVGALIGVGACMIALKGTTPVEDVLLNLGGMFAAVVAIVPTARGEDYQTAVRACSEASGPLLTEKASTGLDCPTVEALAEATRANVENNMVALLFVGFLALLATVLFMLRDRRMNHPADGTDARAWWGFVVAVLVWLGGLVAFWARTQWFVDRAHYVAAAGLFLCIFIVAVENARRQQRKQSGGASGPRQAPNPVGVLISPSRHNSYTWIARAMVVVVVGGIVLWLTHVLTLFWLEILVAALFAVFWTVQTVEQSPRPAPSGPDRPTDSTPEPSPAGSRS